MMFERSLMDTGPEYVTKNPREQKSQFNLIMYIDQKDSTQRKVKVNLNVINSIFDQQSFQMFSKIDT
jgi:hypothetical protein